ncbi:MAG: preprotein translocase subunit SecG [Desulfobacteraceae bacterium]|nr:preprotein translocase subunit SecG [Desulfobacteraceae bacterium]
MHVLIILIHLIVCFALIAIILLQTGKGASMGAMFGGAGNQTLFGQTGASSFLGKATTVAAVVFMLTSLSLAVMSKSGDKSVVGDMKPAAEQSQEATQAPIGGETPDMPAAQQGQSQQTPSPADENAQ